MEIKEYCENCKEFRNLNIKEKSSQYEIRGKNYDYIELVGYCDKCGEEVTTNKLIDENLKRLDSTYRNIENIITKEQINRILLKYKIGKKPLSKLLGWGEVTLTRYINGDIPTKPYSDELFKILKSEDYFLELLEKNKDKITQTAYVAAFNAAHSDFIVTSDIELVAQYIIEKCGEITPLALQKLLYYAQGFYKVFMGGYLFSNDCQAWEHGPVYKEIYDKYKAFKYNFIEQYIDFDIDDILDDDKKCLIDVIVKSFGYYNGRALEKMTHYEKPWIEARRNVPANEKSCNIIEKDKIDEFFSKIKEKYNMINIVEIKKYSEDHFNEVILYNN